MAGTRDLPPVLDLEDNGGLSRANLTAWTQSWLSEVERLTGRRPIIYTGYYFWNDYVASTAFGGYRLWIPRYTSASNPLPLPSSWSTWTLWQHTSTGRVPGIVGNVDLNVFCCPDATLAALADGTGPASAVGNPFGLLDSATRVPDGIRVAGWAIDPDTTGAVTAHVYVDNTFAGAITANMSRPDLAAAFPGWGAAHGFTATVPAGPGTHTVCVYAINQATGNANPRFPCQTVVGTPVGSLDGAFGAGTGALAVRGWALDPDTAGPIAVHTYVDGRGPTIGTADQSRPDLAAAFPGVTAAHGYTTTVSGLGAGLHTACGYAINVGSGATNPLLGCATVTVLSSSPIGSLDVAAGGPGGVTVQGWALDPDTAAPIDARIVVDGASAASSFTANGYRSDVAAAYPASGPDHAFSGFVGGLAPGSHQVCAFGVNAGPGADALIGCRSFVVPTGNPFGSVDGVTSRLSMLTVRGWAIDPDTAAPIGVHVLVDGVDRGTAVAADDRPDVAGAFLGFGSAHGFTATVGGVGGGVHTVCVVGTDVGPGVDAPVGCASHTSSGSPFGSLDSSGRAGSTISLAGWAIDPDTTAPIQVHVYVDGTGWAILTADGSRPDVAADLPWYGPAHGFSATLTGIGAGSHTVCAYAINTAVGSNTTLGCVVR
jgi:hypothetical protein